jgi:Skp family chaperone for outer membrane proteins
MRFLQLLPAVAGLAVVFMLPAQAQQAPTSQSLGGPAVAGVCLLSREAIFANAKVGRAATARLQQLAEQARSSIDAERKPLDADIQAFRAQAASLKPADREAKEKALGQRMQKVQADGAQLGRQVEATRAKAMARIAQEAQPVIASVYKSRNCGLLLDRNAVLGGNMSNDLTAPVVQGLDAKISTISFDLEKLPAGGAQ